MLLTVFILVSIQPVSFINGQSATRSVTCFDSEWRFSQSDPQDASQVGFDDRTWRRLDLPHDWSIEGTVSQDAPTGGSGGYLPAGIGWYRKHFTVKKGDLKMNQLILFDGVYMNSDAWINGKHLGNYPFGYNSFSYNLNDHLKKGENIIAVRVDNSKQSASRWYSGSGIYRHVWLIKTNPLHVAQWGIYITTPEINEDSATVCVNIKLENASSSTQKASLVSYIIDDEELNSGEAESSVQILQGQEQTIRQTINVTSPELWSVEAPVLYSLVTKILIKGMPVDEVTTPFGIRSIRYDVDKGFFLNGKNLKMVGTESVSNGGLRGDYNFGRDTARFNPNYNTRMIRAEQLWKFVAVNPYVIGDFMWTGIDYLGEARWPSKHASSGVIDICGLPKDGYYFYQSQWTEKPMLYIFPHWNREGREGRIIPVLAYTNCEAVELFVNGKSYGEKRLEFPRQGNSGSWMRYDLPLKFATTADLHLSWDVPYESGTVKAVGKKNGQIVCTEIIETTGKPAAIRLTSDVDSIKADNQDVAHVKIEVVDEKGRVVSVADNLIQYKIPGKTILTASSDGMEDVSVVITVLK